MKNSRKEQNNCRNTAQNDNMFVYTTIAKYTIHQDYTSSYEMLREKCNRPMLLIERQRAMLLEVYKCIHELGPRYRHGMFSQKSRAYDYRTPQY